MRKAFENRIGQVVGDHERHATDKVEAELDSIRNTGAREQADRVRQMCIDVTQQLSQDFKLREKELRKTL